MWLGMDTKKNVSRRDWTSCSKFDNYYGFTIQHKLVVVVVVGGDLYDHLITHKIFT